MNTFTIMAIPFFAAAIVMLTLGGNQEKSSLRYRGRRFAGRDRGKRGDGHGATGRVTE